MCVLFCGVVGNPDIPSSWPMLFLPHLLLCFLSLYVSAPLSFQPQNLLGKKQSNGANHKSFQSAFQQDENSGPTEDGKAPIKTGFVHQAQYGSPDPWREAVSNNVL